ncbi:hypothetical protein [Erythrobacter sp.]|jgi:hypothetical protein|uniref:hypothetical protein n=1 Tax=Erythrobacter sp. TaxID=1042 RepID=UPI002ECF2091|nr:hypothetical protein [Erythrobacter sp.]
MSTTKPDLTRWTGAKASAFLKLLARTGKVAPAARSVGMTRQSAYRLRARAPEFARYWDAAMEVAANRKASAGTGQRGKPVHPLLAKGPPNARPDHDATRGAE